MSTDTFKRFFRVICFALLVALFCVLSTIRLQRNPDSDGVAMSQLQVEEVAATPLAKQPAVPNGFTFMETFSGAPTEWRTAGAAIGEIRNRWQCDPRWTYFNLRNDMQVGKPAVLWSKRLFPGDVSVEFYFGIQMDHLRGNPYSYARDMNVTIGSDGSDLRKGCTFSYGGRNNTCSFIQRDGVDLKRMPVCIPVKMDYHLHWFRFRAERYMGKLRFKVDQFLTDEGESVAEWVVDDARPLDGDRVAIWTYNNAIMLSRVWISGEGGKMESPDFLAGPVKTIYDE